MAKKVLTNVSGRMQTFVLAGAHLAANATHRHRYKTVKQVRVAATANGQLVPRIASRSMPDSLRLFAGESREVDELVTHCPAVKDAIARGILRKADPPPAETTTTPASPPASPPPVAPATSSTPKSATPATP